MTEAIKKLRDEMWKEHKDSHKPLGLNKFYYEDNMEYWKNGFDAAWALHEKLVEPLLDIIDREFPGAETAIEKYKSEVGE